MKVVWVALFSFMLSAWVQAGPSGKEVGVVVVVQPGVSLVRDEQTLQPKRGDALILGDRILTDNTGRFSGRLEDDTVMTLGHNSDWLLREFKYEPDQDQGHAVFQATKGAFRVLTGKIQNLSNHKYEVRTPMASIGVRGTDFWGGFIFGDQLDVTVLSGKGVYVTSELGQVVVNEGEGTTVKRAKPQPSAPTAWSDEKLRRAIESVTLD